MGMPELYDNECDECGCFGGKDTILCEDCFKKMNERIKSELCAEFEEGSNIFFRIKMVLRKVGVLDSKFNGSASVHNAKGDDNGS